jgi:MFS family permease
MKDISIYRRNYIALLCEGTFYYTGMSYIDANAVVPVFIFAYTHSMKLVGLAITINMASMAIAQILIGPSIKSIRNMKSFIARGMLLYRFIPALMVPVLLAGLRNDATVVIFLVIYGMVFVGEGLIVIPWNDMFGRTILPEERGRLLGNQLIVGGIGCLLSGLLIKFLLDSKTLSDAQRFSIIFGCAGFFLTISSICMFFSRDLPRTVSARPPSSWHYYSQMLVYLKKNKDFSRMVMIKILAVFSGMVAPFLILFGEKNFILSPTQVSTLVYIQIAGGLVGGYVWGRISHRLSSKHVILTAQIFGLIILTCSLASHLVKGLNAFWPIMWLVILLNGMNMGSWIGIVNYIIDIVSEEDRTVYLLLSNLITFPLTALSFLAGLLIDITGFLPLFLISFTAVVAAVVLSLRLRSPKQLAALREEQSYD